MNERKDAIRDARTLGVPKMLLLGLQHMFAMFGATILVPILVNSYFEGEGLSVQVTLICAGLGTLFFHLCTKLKVPAFLGSSFAFSVQTQHGYRGICLSARQRRANRRREI